MKKMILFAAMLFSLTAMAQTPVITFNETTHDFGKINEADGRVTTIFQFKNEGMVPLILSNVRASCGCTTPKWTRDPIEPGATGEITVTYNPNGRPGRFQKTVTVTSNASEATVRLYIKGEVIPKPANPATSYSVKMGPLSLKQKAWNYGAVVKREGSKICNIEYANLTQQPIKVEIETLYEHSYIKPLVTLKEVQPGESGKLQIALQMMECPIWGPVEEKLYLVINGERKRTDEFAITLKADIREDFSKMTVEELQQAPIMQVANTTLNLGTIKAGKKLSTKLNISNVGVNPLAIRRVVSDDKAVSVTAPKATIKAGKKADAVITVNAADMQPSNYSRVITVISNDPKKSILRVTLHWVVE